MTREFSLFEVIEGGRDDNQASLVYPVQAFSVVTKVSDPKHVVKPPTSPEFQLLEQITGEVPKPGLF